MTLFAIFFFGCPTLTTLWNYIETLISNIIGSPFSIDLKMALFGILPEDVNARQQTINNANLFILIGKMTISKFRYSKRTPNLITLFEYECTLREKYFRHKVKNP